MNSEEIKNEFINCIEGTHTLNLAVSILEDREEYKKEIERLNNKIKMALNYIQNAEGNDINYIATLLLGRPVEVEEKRKQVLEAIGSDEE